MITQPKSVVTDVLAEHAMKTLLLVLCALAAVPSFGQIPEPAVVLLNRGLRDEAAGRLEEAKLILVTLASTYAGHPLAEKAKVEIGALCLYREAQALVREGKTIDGYSAFRTVMRIYPESPLAKLADDASKSLGIPPDPRR